MTHFKKKSLNTICAEKDEISIEKSIFVPSSRLAVLEKMEKKGKTAKERQ